MARNFDIGRQNENLMNQKHYDIYKVMENYLNPPNPKSPESPNIDSDTETTIKSLWLDTYSHPDSADLKYFNGSNWNILFKDKFKITDSLLDFSEPVEAINGQLWIDNGVMKYYDNGYFKPIKAVPYENSMDNSLSYEDFLIISPMEATKSKVVDNFTEFLFAKTPIVAWEINKDYVVNEGAIYDLHIYICRKAHRSSSLIDINNTEYWTRLDFLNQFLVPNSYKDKFFIDGQYVHQKMGWLQPDEITPDPMDEGYSVVTNTCVSFPIEMLDGKYASAVHINPEKLNNIEKKFIMVDKNNPIIEVTEDNTEYYGVEGGLGHLLVKTNNPFSTDYFSVKTNNGNFIRLSDTCAKKYDYIYTIHYEFVEANTRIKQSGTLNKKKIKIQDENYIWIGTVDPSRLCVFAQGLYYENDPANYIYNADDGYLYIKEDLQQYDEVTQEYDFSAIAFPKVVHGKVDNNFDPTLGYKVLLPAEPISQNLIAFVSGVELNIAGADIVDDPNGNPRVKYIPSLTLEMFQANEELYWAVVEVDEYDSEGTLIHEMWRGRTYAVNKDPYGVIVPIYRNKETPVEGALYLGEDEYPIMFVDGILVFQKEIEIENDYLTIYGLKDGQEIVLLADTKDSGQSEFENSDRIIFEDTCSYSTIPIDYSDDTIVYAQNGILCNANAIYSSVTPNSTKASHGEIRLVTNYLEEKWMIYNSYKNEWTEIDPNQKVVDPVDLTEEYLVNIIEKNTKSYVSSKRSISFLQNLGQQPCTYYSYKYADSVEKPLLMGYCYPNGIDGVNNDYPEKNDPKPFKINFRHAYTPGKNEITVFLNGLRQNLDSPYANASEFNNTLSYSEKFNNSKNKECRADRNNEFTLAIDDGTKRGKAINKYDGYFIYSLQKEGASNQLLTYENEMTELDRQKYELEGWTIRELSTPTKNVCFYVIEQCETGETTACERKTLTHKDSLAAKGAFPNNIYDTGDFLLTRGNIRVFINGIRQPFGFYKTVESINKDSTKPLQAYKIIDSKTIQFEDVLIGGMSANEGTDNDVKFPIGRIEMDDGSSKTAYYSVIDEIVIEMRKDFKLREATVPIKDNSGVFSQFKDELPADLFTSKDKIMIYINGLAYGKEYQITLNKNGEEGHIIELKNEEIKELLGNSNKDIITFEWR